jgi:hypothetical protein
MNPDASLNVSLTILSKNRSLTRDKQYCCVCYRNGNKILMSTYKLFLLLLIENEYTKGFLIVGTYALILTTDHWIVNSRTQTDDACTPPPYRMYVIRIDFRFRSSANGIHSIRASSKDLYLLPKHTEKFVLRNLFEL